jgi:hypothetical protein
MCGSSRESRSRGARVARGRRGLSVLRSFLCGSGLITAVVLCGIGCKKEREQSEKRKEVKISELAEVASPLDTGISSNSKQRFINVTRYRLNLALGKKHQGSKWDLWAEGSSRFPLPDGRKAFLISLRRVLGPSEQKGLLVIGRMEGDMPAILGQWSIPASIDDMHVVDLELPVGDLLHTVSMASGKEFNSLYHHLLRYQGGDLKETWSVQGGYATAAPERYSPPVITFVDVDGKTGKEVRVRVPGPKAPKKWKHRWAVFGWSTYEGRFLPQKNLAWSPVAKQKPVWSVFGFLEALNASDSERAHTFLEGGRGCQHPDDLMYAFDPNRWKRSGQLELAAPAREKLGTAHASLVKVPLRKTSGPGRYEAHVTLVGQHSPLPRWTICKVKFLKW